MKIRVVSDLHLEFLKKNEKFSLPVVEADLLVLAGDIHVGTKADSFILHQLQYHDVIYIMGNHEGYEQIFSKLKRALNGPTTKRINQQAKDLGYRGTLYFLDNTVIEVKGVRFLGTTLWTNFSNGNPVVMEDAQHEMSDYKSIKKTSGDI